MKPVNPLADRGFVTLWTRQHEDCLREIHEKGYYRVRYEHLHQKFGQITDLFANAYDWFVQEAERQNPKPQGVRFPIWCSVSAENMLPPEPDSPVLCLRVPEGRVIYFSGQKWDFVLNHRYLPLNESDLISYQKEMDQKGLDATRRAWMMDPSRCHLYPEEVRRVRESWPRVFDYDHWNIFDIQANLWEIKEEDLQDVLYSPLRR